MDSNNSTKTRSTPIATLGLAASFAAALAILTLATIFIRLRRSGHVSDGPAIVSESESDSEEDRAAETVVVIDEAVLEKFPKLLYSEAKAIKTSDANNSSSCPVCLGEYNETDLLKMLPSCGHAFHVKCLDSWLRVRATCPLCRQMPDSVAGGDGKDVTSKGLSA